MRRRSGTSIRAKRSSMSSKARSSTPSTAWGPKTYSAGEALMVPAETVHAVRNAGSGNAVELATDVVEKGKPFLVLVDPVSQ
jgi:hypothetical protein